MHSLALIWKGSISAQSWSTSPVRCGAVMEAIDGAATSMILSASWANYSRLFLSPVDARTMCTLVSRRCRTSFLQKDPSVLLAFSPSNCCIQQSNWVGFRSPSSSVLSNYGNRHCSEAAVRSMSFALIVSYGSSVVAWEWSLWLQWRFLEKGKRQYNWISSFVW